MTTRRLILSACVLCALSTATVANSHASTPKPKYDIGTAVIKRLAPPWPCTMENRLEIFVDEDRIMYACECEALSSGHICRWQVIGGVESRVARRFKQHHPRLVVSYAKASVAA